MDVLPAHLNRDSFRDSFKGLVALEIIFDLPFGFPTKSIISHTYVIVFIYVLKAKYACGLQQVPAYWIDVAFITP